MEQIVKTFLGIFFAMLIIITGNSVLTAQAEVTEARNFKNDVISELENSDFSAGVINACFESAAERNYQMKLTVFHQDGGAAEVYESAEAADSAPVSMADVEIKYQVRILGKEQEKTVRGCSR